MLKRIRVEKLRQGMYIKEMYGSWLEHPFWLRSFKLARPRDLKRILESAVAEVCIDTARGLDVEDVPSADASEQSAEDIAGNALLDGGAVPQLPVCSTEPASMENELENARRICANSRGAVTSMFQEARMGRAIDAAQADALVSEISASVMRNPDALISVARLKTADDYTYMHSVAVCALMIALGRKIGLGEKDLREAGLAGLLHDVGKMSIPMEILNKPGKLTDEEFARVRKHPREGHRMLCEGGGASAVSLDVCLHHHEKTDGSGYPDRLAGDRISQFAKMGAVCDVYDAITSDRLYKKGWDPSEALHKMAEWKTGHFDDAIFRAFVKSIGIYPVGSLVRLHSGRLGLIVEQTGKSLISPKIKVFYCTRLKARITPRVVDLSSPESGEQIAAREDPENWKFPDLGTLWQ